MAVRFLPPPEESADDSGGEHRDRENLAEVISLRSRLPQRSWTAESRTVDTARSDEQRVERQRRREQNLAERAPGRGESPGSDETAPPQTLTDHPSLPEGHLERASERRFESADGPAAPERSVYDEGVRLLARRARSSGELRGELERLGHDAAEVEAIIDEFARSHYLDDLGLARVLTEKLRDSKRASRTQIRMKLRERRLPDDVIEAAVGELDGDEEFALLREAAENRARRLRGLDRQTAERRLLGFLARRGWGGEPAMRAARAALDAEARDSGGGVRFR